MLDAESSGAQSVRMANGQMQNITDARIVLQDAEIENNERTNKVKEVYLAEQEKINADIAKLESDKVAALVETTAETESINAANIKALELHTRNMEGIDNKETEMRTKFLQQQNDIMDDDSKFTGFSDALKDLTSGVIDLGGWADDATKFVNNVQTVMQGIGSQVAKVSKKLFSILPDSIQEKLGDAWKSMSGGLKRMGTQFLNMGKQFLKGAARMAISAATLVAGMLSTAATVLISGIVMLAPAILIGLAIAGLIFGIMYLAKKFEENKEMIMFKWGLIQEGFSIAIDGLILWKDKAVNFIGNVFEDIWMSIKSLFSAVLSGIENGINFAIQGINSFLPERMQLDEVDIGAKGMAAGLEEEKAALAIERDAEAVEFAERKDELDERKATVIENFKLDEVPKDGKPLSLENAQAANAMTGEDIAVATTEVKQGEKQGNQVNVVNTSSSPTTVSNTQVHTGSGSPRDTDRTAVGLNAIAV
jgi:ABC-type multidrug transport system fused ATPase/permease subunit